MLPGQGLTPGETSADLVIGYWPLAGFYVQPRLTE